MGRGVADPHAVQDLLQLLPLTDDRRLRSALEECKGGSSQCWIRFHSVEHTHTITLSHCIVLNTIYFPLFFERTEIHPEWAPVVLYIVVGKYLMLQLPCHSA
ncbi:hypothetical protein EXN66_Car019403 [Channa argus]|uniref:Uncharacterized protein n=1 Tax=Channa argus TaxID=215402 RepID=A0A6G1QMD9_CHAAH|nr:hypothetical protein EXN66_Car019403 [Channa argus]